MGVQVAVTALVWAVSAVGILVGVTQILKDHPALAPIKPHLTQLSTALGALIAGVVVYAMGMHNLTFQVLAVVFGGVIPESSWRLLLKDQQPLGLILKAIGRGVFNNPPEAIATIAQNLNAALPSVVNLDATNAKQLRDLIATYGAELDRKLTADKPAP